MKLQNGEEFNATFELMAGMLYILCVTVTAVAMATKFRISGWTMKDQAPVVYFIGFAIFEALGFTVATVQEQLKFGGSCEGSSPTSCDLLQILFFVLMCTNGGFKWMCNLAFLLENHKHCAVLTMGIAGPLWGLLCLCLGVAGLPGPLIILVFLLFFEIMLISSFAVAVKACRHPASDWRAAFYLCLVLSCLAVHVYHVSFGVAPLTRYTYSLILKNTLNALAFPQVGASWIFLMEMVHPKEAADAADVNAKSAPADVGFDCVEAV